MPRCRGTCQPRMSPRPLTEGDRELMAQMGFSASFHHDSRRDSLSMTPQETIRNQLQPPNSTLLSSLIICWTLLSHHCSPLFLPSSSPILTHTPLRTYPTPPSPKFPPFLSTPASPYLFSPAPRIGSSTSFSSPHFSLPSIPPLPVLPTSPPYYTSNIPSPLCPQARIVATSAGRQCLPAQGQDAATSRRRVKYICPGWHRFSARPGSQ